MSFGLLLRGSVAGACIAALIACSSSAPPPPEDLIDENPQPSKKPDSSSGGTKAAEVQKADASPDATSEACATVPPNNRCGLDPQCGCGANETCDVTNDVTGATSCVSAGSATLGRPCTQTGDCLAGFTCAYGACRPYCKTPGTKCGVGGTYLCVQSKNTDGKPIPNRAFCTINCDPRLPSAVCGTNGCEWFAEAYAPDKVSDCNRAGTKTALAPCDYTDECLPGHACIDHPSSKIGYECEQWCRIGQSPSDCKSGFTCKDVFGAKAPVINGVKEGVCQD